VSHIHLVRRHHLGRKRAAAKVERLRQELSAAHEFEGEWHDQVLHISRTGAHGDIEVGKDAIEVRVELGMLLRPWRERIQREIEAHLDTLFPERDA
jgi:putative polyhydroxyalkanoate system protein